jgi:glycerol kinase
VSGYILAIDQGTTSTRAIIFGYDQKEIQQHFPQSGWVEHDALEIWRTVIITARNAMRMAGVTAAEVAVIGVTNQRETCCYGTRPAVNPFIVPSSGKIGGRRQPVSASFATVCRVWSSKERACAWTHIFPRRRRLGCSTTFQVQGAAEAGEVLFGTIDTYLVWMLTGGAIHATNASRTLLYDIERNCWDEDLLAIFRIPRSILPEVKDTAANFGLTLDEHFGGAIPILGIAGDQQAAMIGHACFEPGMIKSTYGTGCFVVLNTGEQIARSRNRMLSTIAYRLNGKATYALEGSIFVAGAAVQWLRDSLGLIKRADETGLLALAANDRQDVYLVPACVGCDVERPPFKETTALGAAALAASKAGVWPDLLSFGKDREAGRRFAPTSSNSQRDSRYSRWKAAVASTLSFADASPRHCTTKSVQSWKGNDEPFHSRRLCCRRRDLRLWDRLRCGWPGLFRRTRRDQRFRFGYLIGRHQSYPWRPAASRTLRIPSGAGHHIVVRKKFDDPRAFIFQNPGNRIIFSIPYEQDFILTGTTDRDCDCDPKDVKITKDEISYVCTAASEYFKEPVGPEDIVWTYSAVRPLYNNGVSKAQEATRDYVLKMEAGSGRAPLLNVFGGKLTTYRRLGEYALEKLAQAISVKGARRTAKRHLSSGDFYAQGCLTEVGRLQSAYLFHNEAHAKGLVRAYGTKENVLLGKAHSIVELGRYFGPDIYEAEVRYLMQHDGPLLPTTSSGGAAKGAFLSTRRKRPPFNSLFSKPAGGQSPRNKLFIRVEHDHHRATSAQQI